MRITISVLAVCLFTLCRFAYSHGDHSIPGVKPPGLHGGVVGEADHAEEEHDHDEAAEGKAAEKSLFFETVYDAGKKKVSIFPLSLDSSKSVLFSPIPPSAVSITSLKFQFPRQNKTVTVQPVAVGQGFEAPIQVGSAARFFVMVDATHAGEKKTAKIQVEINK